MKLIGFGFCSPELFLMVGIQLFWVSMTLSAFKLSTLGIDKHPIFLSMSFACGWVIVGGTAEVISIILKNSKQKKQSNANNDMEKKINTTLNGFQLAIVNKKDYTALKNTLLILFGGIVSFLYYNFLHFFSGYNESGHTLGNQMKTTCVIMTGLLSAKALKTELHRHHIVSIIGITIGIIMLIIDLFRAIKIEIFLIICYFISYAFISTKEVCDKWIMETQFITPSKLLLIEGLIQIILNVIFFIAIIFIPCPSYLNFCKERGTIENGKVFFQDVFQKDAIIYIIMLTLSGGIINFLGFTLSHKLSVTHKAVTDSVTSLFLTILLLFDYEQKEKKKLWIGLELTAYFLIIGFGFIFIELIILYPFKMGENTKKEIMNRSLEIDYLLQLKDQTSIDEDKIMLNNNESDK